VLTSLLVILLITPFIVQDVAASVSTRQVTRLNYGVVFSPVRRVKLVSDFWSHIFDLLLPDTTPGNLHLQLPYCNNATRNEMEEGRKRICEHNRALLVELYKQHTDMSEQILQALQHIYHLLPADRSISQIYKRSLLPIGGYILSGLFGTASEADLKPIKDHMKRVAQGVSQINEGLQLHQKHLASFIEMTAQRMDSFRNLTTMQERTIDNLREDILIMENVEAQDQQRLVFALQKVQQYITQLRHIDQFRQAIELLLHGFLTPQLLPKDVLQSNLLVIKLHLRTYFPNFHLIFDKARSFYAMHDFLFGRHGRHLLIQIRIPVTTFHHEFTVYKVTTFPVPVTGRSSHSTSLSDVPNYFVTSRQSPFHFDMQHDDNSRHRKLLYLTGSSIVLRSYQSGATCVSALFQNNVSQIRDLCSFSLQERILEPNFHFLSNNQILLTNVPEMLLQCGSNNKILEGCTQCIRQVPCNCAGKMFLQNSTFPTYYWPPKIANCHLTFNVSQSRHVINLASLQSFFSDSSLGDLSGNTYLTDPLHVQLPAFRHYKHEFQQLISKDVTRSHNLRKFADRVRNDSLIFHEVSDVVLDQMSKIISADDNDLLITSRFTSVTWWLTWSGILCSYLSLILVLFLFYKFKIFGSALVFLRSGTAAEPTSFPKFLAYDKSVKTSPQLSNSTQISPVFTVDTAAIFDLTTVLLLAVLCIILLLVWLYFVNSKSNRLYLVLEIGNANTCVRIRCLRLFSAIYAYQFHANCYIKTVSVAGYWPKLFIDWPGFFISHILEDMTLKFPTKILMNHWDAYNVKRILTSKSFYVLCLLEYNDNYRLVDFESTVNPSTQAIFLGENDVSSPPDLRSREITANVSIPMSVYPSLTQLPANPADEG